MAVKNLNCLVLRGSAVLLVGKAGNPRLGSDTTAKPAASAIGISMPRPLQDGMPEGIPARRLGHAASCCIDSWAVAGAGRSRRCTGALSRSRMRRSNTIAAPLA